MLRPSSLLVFIAMGGCGRAPGAAPTLPDRGGPPAAVASAPSSQVAPVAVASSATPAADPPVPAAFPGHHHDIDEPELVHFNATRGVLGGFLYKPKGDGPFPAVIFNHGSEQLPGSKFGQALFYVAHGFVLFVPHRLGHGQSPGEYIVDASERAPAAQRDAKLVALLEAQVDDVADATTYLRALSFVKGDQMAMTGCSFGGIETLLAAERGLGLRAAVDFSGAAMTWADNAPLRGRMRDAAKNAKTPVFFAQAANDYDIQPSVQLAAAMETAGKPHLLKIFPAHGTTPEEGHEFCMGGMRPAWGEDVLAFFAANGVKGSAVPPHAR